MYFRELHASYYSPRAATSSTASYITTPGPVLHDISHVYCEEIDDYYKRNV